MTAISLPRAPWDPAPDLAAETVLSESIAPPSPAEAVLIARPAPKIERAPTPSPVYDDAFFGAALIQLLDDLTETKRRLNLALDRITALEGGAYRRRP